VLSKRKSLKGKGIVITEQLTARKTQLLRKANELAAALKIHSPWTHDGKIIVKAMDNSTLVLTAENIK